MTVQPTYHWQFNEREGSVTRDEIKDVEANLVNSSFQGHGRIGPAILLSDLKNHVQFSGGVGQFGINDFTIAFGMNILSTHDQDKLDIIGNRSVGQHDNWFALRLINKKRLRFEVDEDHNGTNHVFAQTEPILTASNWYHVAIVREGLTLRIYVDGAKQAEATSKTGKADIANDVDLRLGHYVEGTAKASYEDLRIYDTALSDAEIRSLIPPQKPILLPGQIELVAVDNASVILSQDETDLSRYSTEFQRLRLGPDTGVTLYHDNNFEGVSQKLYADIPEIRSTKVDAFPKSIQIWSSIGAPFTGKWIISAGNGQYLHQNKNQLESSKQHSSGGFFTFQYNPQTHRTLLIPANNTEMPLLKVGDENASILVVDNSEFQRAAFSIVHSSGDKWLKLNGRLSWTEERNDRTLFYRVMKVADSEEQVGEITEGEVALYQHASYHGKAWVLSDYEPGVNGDFKDLSDFDGLNNTISSLRLGPNTGVTLFANEEQMFDEATRETEIEDHLKNIPDMGETQIKHDNASSLKIFREVKPDAIFTSYVSKLSEDYRLVGDELERFSAYRTTLRFASTDVKVEISATDTTTIEVEDTLYEIDEVRSVILQPNVLNRMMITSEADGLSTPGLKFRTQEMAENERVIIFPHEEVHKQIAELEDDALWDAEDAEGNPIVDKNRFSKTEIASVQNTISQAMATVVTTPDDPIISDAASIPVALSNFKSVSGFSRVISTQQRVSADVIDKPWTLNFQPPPITSSISGGSAGLVAMPDSIWEEPVEQNSFEQLFAQAEPAVEPVKIIGPASVDGTFAIRSSVRGFFGSIGDAIKDAAKVTLGVLDGAFSAIVTIGGQIVRFVLDTAKRVADFVEAVVQKVVKGIKQFIEFLQFLFDWDAILETKDFLVDTINNALDSASDMVEAAKEPVDTFFNDLQEDLDTGFDNLIELLGVNPDKDGGFELPEAAEWFLSKIMGGGDGLAEEAKDKVSDELAEITNLSPIVQTFLEILDEIQSVTEVGTQIRDEALFEIIESLIENPLQPKLILVGLIEAMRTVASDLLKTANTVAIKFLELVIMVIDEFKKILNTKLKMPLISALFDFIGAGDLTILNLAGLLVAIPATIISKIMFGEAPFQDVPKPEFPAGNVALRTSSVQAGEEQTVDDEEKRKQRRKIRGFGTVALGADLFNGLISTYLDMVPHDLDDIPNINDLRSTEKNVAIENTLAKLKFNTKLEVLSVVLSWMSWFGSFPASPSAEYWKHP